MQILVLGATGFVGGSLVPALLEAGHEVRALSRNRDRATATLDDRVEVVEGDVLDPETLDGVFEGIELVYYLVHSMDAGGQYEQRDRQAADNVATAASEAGVDRLIYLGGLGETGNDLSTHLASRREVEGRLADGEYDLTTFRAAIVVGAGSESFEMVRQMVKRIPVMITPTWVRTPAQPIAISDVVAYLSKAATTPETAGKTLEIGGPEVLSYEEMMRRTAAVMGRRLYVFPVPFLTPKISVYWIDLVTDTPPSISHPLIEGLKNPVVVTDERAQELLDVELTPFDEAVETAVTSARST
ncbi:NAD(P)H-binding protein [Halovenus salina]|uniref:NAD(P)H-binding protein n=1 Tax=Halovenus salina TaxID=1510225 RepID=A0ABD5W2L9_9EURY|nr:NAD(P)H-binding protein [Halovenus salina]